MTETFKSGEDARPWHDKYGLLAPNSGDPAPDFELSDPTGKNPVRLSAFNGKSPVALVFGSFT